jgi:hypothetical protein
VLLTVAIVASLAVPAVAAGVEPAGGLPDGRAYEQATPVDKNGNNAAGTANNVLTSPDGGAITFFATGGIPGGEGAQAYPTYLAVRAADGSGWSTQGLMPPASLGSSAALLGVSEDLDRAYVTQAGEPGAPASFLERDSVDGTLRTIAAGPVSGNYQYAASSADDSQVLFQAKGSLGVPGAAPGTATNTYLWDAAGGHLVLAGVLNDGSAPSGGAFAGSNRIFSLNTPHYTQTEHAISNDSSRVFFTSAAATGNQLYVRNNPTQPQSPLDGEGECEVEALACTVEISESVRAVPDPNGEKPTRFVGASADGSVAYFISSSALTEDANTGSEDEGADLYRYDVGGRTLTDLAPLASGNGAEVQGVLGMSEDGSYVYFAANGVLAPGAVAGSCTEAGEGRCNLYVWHEGGISFISEMVLEGVLPKKSDISNWFPGTVERAQRAAEVSPDGLTLLFRSIGQPTGYDNEGPCAEGGPGPCSEIYRYRYGGPTPSCISCDLGASPLGAATLQSTVSLQGSPQKATLPRRNLSADGDRIFFETPDPLVSADTNGEAGCPIVEPEFEVHACQDVYEWEAQGTGSCRSASENGGCLYLISTGESPDPSYFADAGTEGEDVFFFTSQPLVGQDADDAVDIYDARVGGGIASQSPSPATSCTDEGCKSSMPSPPQVPSPGTPGFVGPPNPIPLHCRKGRVRRGGRCVRPHRKHKHRRHRKNTTGGRR